MPARLALHEGNAFSGNGVRDDDGRFFPRAFATIARVDDVAHVVSVNF